VKPVVDVVDEADVEVLLELVEVDVVATVLVVVLVLVVLLVGGLVVLVVLVVGGVLVVVELLLVVDVVLLVVGAWVAVVEVLLLVLVVGPGADVVVLGVANVLLLELDVLVDAGSGCVVRVVLVLVEFGRGRNVEDVVLGRSCGAGQRAGAAAFRAANRPGASFFTAPPSKSRQ
jgi:hypothetical protein